MDRRRVRQGRDQALVGVRTSSPFHWSNIEATGSSPRLTLKINGRTEALPATGNYPNDGDIRKVIFAGFGITAPELDYDDYARIDAHGKIVLVFNHEPQEDDAKSIFNGKATPAMPTPAQKCSMPRATVRSRCW